MQLSINSADKDLKGLDFEVSMLPMGERDGPKEMLLKLRTRYNNCRKLYFQAEDRLGKEVIQP